ncbi:peptide/nickel transport system permease protein [Pseudoclavibacter sp. JAI123]|uniref:ABC transporter permease n=1 Tax=Pseudoclavibacter sp. JAI123 TaxID=2723065 RepID=UPI0015CD7441|nr:ABC transporter permease [Pseudoclavibacter sp. JAI123]NYF12644.1 peptide/nickel transport system permease protein [Pseudoclavibacter sp. JAI123]
MSLTSARRVPAPAPSGFQTAPSRVWILRHITGSPSLVASSLVVLVVLSWAVAPWLFVSGDPLYGDTSMRLLPPSAEHWFGTDNLGRDVFTRIVYGAAESLRATTLAVAVGLVGGSAIGLISGFIGGRVDTALMRVIDVLLAIPSLLLALMVVTALGFGTTKVAIAVGVVAVASFARVMRAQVLRVRHSPFIEAATGLGMRWPTVLVKHVLPNSFGPVLALAAIEFGTAVLSIAALSFLGYGNPPPAPEWGSTVAEGRNYLATAWWLTTMPGLVIISLVLATNRLSRGFEHRQGER